MYQKPERLGKNEQERLRKRAREIEKKSKRD
jgi:hypothetical protein